MQTNCYSWFDCVARKSNLADGPTRMESDRISGIPQGRVNVHPLRETEEYGSVRGHRGRHSCRHLLRLPREKGTMVPRTRSQRWSAQVECTHRLDKHVLDKTALDKTFGVSASPFDL